MKSKSIFIGIIVLILTFFSAIDVTAQWWGGGWWGSTTTTTAAATTTTSGGGGGGSNTIVVRALGVAGSEHIYVTVGGSQIGNWTLSTSYQNYSASTSNTGSIEVCFDNDDGQDRDVQVDYIEVNGSRRQAEDQASNTGVWQNSSCGGEYSEMLHCEGCINFGNVSGGGGTTTTAASTTTSGSTTTTASSTTTTSSWWGGGWWGSTTTTAATTTTTTSGGATTTTSGGGGSNTILVRARGEGSGAHINLTVGGSTIGDWNLSTSYQNYSASTSNTGSIEVCFDNDDGQDRDVQVDYIEVNGSRRQAEDQSSNTGVWQNSSCGGSNSEWLHCEGCINFGNVSGGGGTTTTTAASTTTTTSGGYTTTTSGGGGCNIPSMPSYSSLSSNSRLPDPFKFMDGSRMSSSSQWSCRRAEISALAQHFEFGTKPGKPSSVSGSYSNNRITVNCSNGGSSISFSCSISYPSSGSAPYPAIIGIGSSSLNNSLLSSLGVAVISFPNDEIAAQSGSSSRGQGKFYDLYGSNHSAGALIAWAWGVSRLIDALESTSAANIDASRIGVTGCSRNGKGALVAGAFDERVDLTIPQESGSGGAASWRVSDYQKSQGQDVQTLSQIVTENCWFRENFSQFSNTAERLPFDHHMIEGLCAPRALLVIENTSMEWLGNLSCYVTARAARMIYQGLGVSDRMGFSQVGHSDHCGFPSSQDNDLRAFVQRFLLNGSANTDIMRTDGNLSFDQARWVDWSASLSEENTFDEPTTMDAIEVTENGVSVLNASSGIDIRLSVAAIEEVKVEIYNILGQKMEKLMDEVKSSGNYTLHWNGNKGIYFVRVEIGNKVYKKKAVILK